MTIPRLLVVDDDAEMRQMMVHLLQSSGFIAMPASSEADILDRLEDSRIDLILLDVMLGRENGIEICKRLRESQDVPVIVVSALSADHQRMAGYDVGADDYIAKPFNADLLLARIRAVLKRTRRTSSLVHRRKTSVFEFAGWHYDSKRDELHSPEGFLVALSKRESSLLNVFLANPHIPLTRDEIAAAMDTTGAVDRDPSGRALDVLLGRLRSKIEKTPKSPDYLKTERGTGYVFAVDVTERRD